MARPTRTRTAAQSRAPSGRWLSMFAVLTWARHCNWPAVELAAGTIGAGEATWRQWVREADLDVLEVVRELLAPKAEATAQEES